MSRAISLVAPTVGLLVLLAVAPGSAQPLGTFAWQLQPFCNRVIVSVTQNGGLYTLDGFDDQCGAQQRAPLVGLATSNPDQTIGMGFHIVTVPGGRPVHVEARIGLASLNGTWRDSAGNTGAFVLGANLAGNPRPAPVAGLGDITAVAAGTGLSGGGTVGDVSLEVDPEVVQRRVNQACGAGEAVQSIGQDGSVVCAAVGGTGDITAVLAGSGLLGGGTSGEVGLAVAFGGGGSQALAARADHQHTNGSLNTVLGVNANPAGGSSNTVVGAFALNAGTTAVQNTAVGVGALQQTSTALNSTAVGMNALFAANANDNTAVGAFAMADTSTGAANTAVGRFALRNANGSGNTAVGTNAGVSVTSGSDATLLGAGANLGSGGLVNATAIGARARADQSNALVLGSITGINGATADARVGIGTTSPEAALEVVVSGAGTTPHAAYTRFIAAPGLGAVTAFRRARGTRDAPAAVLSGDALGALQFGGYDGAVFGMQASIAALATEDFTAGSRGTMLGFFAGANPEVQGLVMSVNPNGRVGIGTSTPNERLDVRGDIRIGTFGTNGCIKDANGGALIGTCSSDSRFKRDVTAFGPSLDRVARLRPVHYFWRSEEFPEKGFGQGQAYGLVAQEAEAVIPELVTVDERGYKAVDYTRLPLLAIQAIRELKQRNDALEQRLATLEALMASRPSK